MFSLHGQSHATARGPAGRLSIQCPTRFLVGDCVVLVATTAAATWVMMAVHEFMMNAAVGMIAGMLASMRASTIIAAGAAVVLGSIETKVPAMVAGMLGPMPTWAFCVAGQVHLSIGTCTAIGAATGLALSLALMAYGRRCRSDFAQGRWLC